MKTTPLLLLLISSFLLGDEYDFDMDAIESIEPKSYEYNGYLRVDDRFQRLNTESPLYIQSGDDRRYQNNVHLEGLFEFTYFYEMFTFKTSLMGTYDYVYDTISEDDYPVNELYVDAKITDNHALLVGKESLKWGKGYYFNPVAFFDRPKDPQQPTVAREGFSILKYSYNKSFQGALKNVAFDLVYLRADDKINKDFYHIATDSKISNNIGARLYLLLFDTDIDIIYDYSDAVHDKIGIDFSKNLQTNFEVHGEFAKEISGYHSYLLGLRYLTDFELTIISEYVYRSNGLNEEEIKETNTTIPFIAKNYAITWVSQKEPFDLLYASLYFKNMLNLQDHSHQDKLGATYSFRNNIEVDLSYNINSGSDLSEFGKKSVQDFVWLKTMWHF
ncbi:MAG: hypothetical protein ABFR02_01190 [Campylobacterota bacterium]